MSIFDRLISTLTGGHEAAAPAPGKQPVAPAVAHGEGKRQRFMGRDDGRPAVETPAVEKGLEAPSMIWLYAQPSSQSLLLVSDLGVAQGELLTAKMRTDLVRAGLCEEVAYHAGNDEYWKMPSQEAILRTPSLYHIAMPLPHQMKVQTRLVKPNEPRGFWMRVRMREAHELQQPDTLV